MWMENFSAFRRGSMLCDFYPKETRNVLNQVIRLLDESMDFSFNIDCGSEKG